jgi:hypothetical protein
MSIDCRRDNNHVATSGIVTMVMYFYIVTGCGISTYKVT